MFLKDYAPWILKEFELGLGLATVRCSCEYLDEIRAFEEVVIQMSLAGLSQNRITLKFEYFCDRDGIQKTVALGEQQIACVRYDGEQSIPVALPILLREALTSFSS